jgi:hypothetical protein
MRTTSTRHTWVLLSALLAAAPASMAQLINDPLEPLGDESYQPGGFGAFNWVDAATQGFPNHQGQTAFLTAYSGTPIEDIGMTKPLGGAMSSTNYRVSFYMAKYYASGIPFAEFSELYIGSANGTSVWDSVPTPTVDGEWLRWSGTFTPDASDIGSPFSFGFTLTLLSQRSMAIDGPLTVEDLSTGNVQTFDPHDDHQPRIAQNAHGISITGAVPLRSVRVIDAQGREHETQCALTSGSATISTEGLSRGFYLIRWEGTDGSLMAHRFAVH